MLLGFLLEKSNFGAFNKGYEFSYFCLFYENGRMYAIDACRHGYDGGKGILAFLVCYYIFRMEPFWL